MGSVNRQEKTLICATHRELQPLHWLKSQKKAADGQFPNNVQLACSGEQLVAPLSIM